MNYNQPIPTRPQPYQRAPQSQQTPQKPAEAGTDPSAVIAARSAAVARNRQREARTAMVRDVMRIIFVAAIIGGIACVFFWKHKQTLEEERLRALNEQRMREEQARERKERDARFAAEREAHRKIKQAEADERRRKEEERKRASEQQVAAARRLAANVKRYKDAIARFRGATLDLISSAPPADLPVNVSSETWYSCVVPGGRAGITLYEVQALPGKDIRVTRLEEAGEATDIKFDEFGHQMARMPFLLVKGTRCYYKPEHKTWEWRVSVPADNAKLNPSSEDFRDLFEFARKQFGKDSLVSYEVSFRDVGGMETRIISVPFGEHFTRADVAQGLASADSGRRRSGGNDIQSRLNGGKLVIRRKGLYR